MTTNAGTDAALAVAAAQAGAAVVRASYGRALARFDKSGGDFATEADLAAERVIVDVIRAARPADAVTVRRPAAPARTARSAGGWSIPCAAR